MSTARISGARRVPRAWLFPIPFAVLIAFGAFLFALRECAESTQEQAPLSPVDLLALLELDNDSLRGSWEIQAGALVSPTEIDALLQIPFAPPREYDLEMVIEWKDGPDGFGVGLAVPPAQVLAALDSHGHTLSGLTLVDGKTAEANATTYRGRLFEKDRPVKFLFSVRRGRVEISADGRTIIEWTGDPKALSLRAPWTPRSREALFLCSLNGTYRVLRSVLTPLSGRGRRLR
jgi:hypothetical protein